MSVIIFCTWTDKRNKKNDDWGEETRQGNILLFNILSAMTITSCIYFQSSIFKIKSKNTHVNQRNKCTTGLDNILLCTNIKLLYWISNNFKSQNNNKWNTYIDINIFVWVDKKIYFIPSKCLINVFIILKIMLMIKNIDVNRLVFYKKQDAINTENWKKKKNNKNIKSSPSSW